MNEEYLERLESADNPEKLADVMMRHPVFLGWVERGIQEMETHANE